MPPLLPGRSSTRPRRSCVRVRPAPVPGTGPEGCLPVAGRERAESCTGRSSLRSHSSPGARHHPGARLPQRAAQGRGSNLRSHRSTAGRQLRTRGPTPSWLDRRPTLRLAPTPCGAAHENAGRVQAKPLRGRYASLDTPDNLERPERRGGGRGMVAPMVMAEAEPGLYAAVCSHLPPPFGVRCGERSSVGAGGLSCCQGHLSTPGQGQPRDTPVVTAPNPGRPATPGPPISREPPRSRSSGPVASRPSPDHPSTQQPPGG